MLFMEPYNSHLPGEYKNNDQRNKKNLKRLQETSITKTKKGKFLMKIPYCINRWLLSDFSMSVGQKVYVSLFRFIIFP